MGNSAVTKNITGKNHPYISNDEKTRSYGVIAMIPMKMYITIERKNAHGSRGLVRKRKSVGN